MYVVPQVKLVRLEVKAPVEYEPDVEVMVPYDVVGPYSNPLTVELTPPVLVMFPFRVASVLVIDVADDTVTVGDPGFATVHDIDRLEVLALFEASLHLT